MDENNFFKPTLLYKEFMILDLIDKNSSITQRTLSKEVGVAVSMINAYVDDFEKKGYLKREYISSKTVLYSLTKKGKDRIKVLNIGFLSSTQKIFKLAKENINQFISKIYKENFKKIVLYGAGEVSEILLDTIYSDTNRKITILAVVDDEKEKQGKKIKDIPIIALADLMNIEHDGVLISSYTNNRVMNDKLFKSNYPKTKIIHYF